eukprot:3628123-Amphidinium_carterae.2
MKFAPRWHRYYLKQTGTLSTYAGCPDACIFDRTTWVNMTDRQFVSLGMKKGSDRVDCRLLNSDRKCNTVADCAKQSLEDHGEDQTEVHCVSWKACGVPASSSLMT